MFHFYIKIKRNQFSCKKNSNTKRMHIHLKGPINLKKVGFHAVTTHFFKSFLNLFVPVRNIKVVKLSVQEATSSSICQYIPFFSNTLLATESCSEVLRQLRCTNAFIAAHQRTVMHLHCQKWCMSILLDILLCCQLKKIELAAFLQLIANKLRIPRGKWDLSFSIFK